MQSDKTRSSFRTGLAASVPAAHHRASHREEHFWNIYATKRFQRVFVCTLLHVFVVQSEHQQPLHMGVSVTTPLRVLGLAQAPNRRDETASDDQACVQKV